MQIALPFAEAIALVVAKEPLPPMVRDLRCEGSTIHADIDLRAIPDPSTACASPPLRSARSRSPSGSPTTPRAW